VARRAREHVEDRNVPSRKVKESDEVRNNIQYLDLLKPCLEKFHLDLSQIPGYVQ
jgi:hypothetical protein